MNRDFDRNFRLAFSGASNRSAVIAFPAVQQLLRRLLTNVSLPSRSLRFQLESVSPPWRLYEIELGNPRIHSKILIFFVETYSDRQRARELANVCVEAFGHGHSPEITYNTYRQRYLIK